MKVELESAEQSDNRNAQEHAKDLGGWYGKWQKLEESLGWIQRPNIWELEGAVSILRKAEQVRGIGDALKTNLRIEREELDRLLVAVAVSIPPPGHQMNYIFNYCIWCIATRVKDENQGRQCWEKVADLISTFFPVAAGWDSKSAQKSYKQFTDLENDPKKRSAIISSILFKLWAFLKIHHPPVAT